MHAKNQSSGISAAEGGAVTIPAWLVWVWAFYLAFVFAMWVPW